jgi:hypothetical protein
VSSDVPSIRRRSAVWSRWIVGVTVTVHANVAEISTSALASIAVRLASLAQA